MDENCSNNIYGRLVDSDMREIRTRERLEKEIDVEDDCDELEEIEEDDFADFEDDNDDLF